MRRTALVALVVFSVVAPPHVASAQAGTEPKIEQVPAAIVELLDDYAHAYRNEDALLLASTVAKDLLPSERKARENSRNITLSSFRVRVTTQFSGNLASPRIRARYPGREVLTYHV